VDLERRESPASSANAVAKSWCPEPELLPKLNWRRLRNYSDKGRLHWPGIGWRYYFKDGFEIGLLSGQDLLEFAQVVAGAKTLCGQ